jgi:hypothetical protein
MTDNIRHFTDGEIVGDKDITIEVLGSIMDFNTNHLPTCYYSDVMSIVEFKHPTKELNELCKIGDSIHALNIFRSEYIGFKKSDFYKIVEDNFLALNSVCYNLFFTKVGTNQWKVEYGRMCADGHPYVMQPMFSHIVIDPLFGCAPIEPENFLYPKWPDELVLTAKIERKENGKD